MIAKLMTYPVLTIRYLSINLKVSQATLHKFAQKGKFSAQKVTGHWRFSQEAVDIWLVPCAQASAEQR